MPGSVVELGGQLCLIAAADDPLVSDANGARDLIEEAMGEGVSVIAVPVERLDPSFFQLRTGLAGEVLQKAVNYGFTLAIIGKVSGYVAASDAFRDLVVEADGGRSLLFAPDLQTLETRLAGISAAR